MERVNVLNSALVALKQSVYQPMAFIKIYLFSPKKPIRRVLKNRPDIWLAWEDMR